MNVQSIYIVEDEIITARSIAKNIKKFGYQLAGIANSGSEALKEVARVKPDLILMDILLNKNDIDGITTAQQIQSQINVPVIYLTAHCDRETLDRAKITTPFGYILKPYRKKELQISIEFALHKHQQEIHLVEREKLLSTILNATQEGVIAANKTSNIIYMNPAAQHLTGWNLNEAYEQQAAKVIPIIDERTQQLITNPIEQVLEQGKIIYLDEYAVLLQKDGGQTSIRDSVSPIMNQDQDQGLPPSELVEGAVLIFTPRQTSSHLESDTNQPQNLTAREGEQKINELSAYLMDVVLHELRSPLTVILSTTQSLQKYRQKWTEDKQNRNFGRIQQAIQEITRLLDDVTLWEDLGTEQITWQPEWFNVVNLSKDILSGLRLIDSNNHQLTMITQGDEELFYIDPAVLRRILNNLLLNGIKYSAPGKEVTLTINCTKNRLVVQVKDQGRGIPFTEQSRIFQPFYRASNTEKIKGTGLGLAIVKKYVQLCGGEITLESSTASGSIFTVTLPASYHNSISESS
ncbi:MAG: ATP-binding protein [Cyanobacteria bacterium P01_A01_bin.40]